MSPTTPCLNFGVCVVSFEQRFYPTSEPHPGTTDDDGRVSIVAVHIVISLYTGTNMAIRMAVMAIAIITSTTV